VPYLQPVKECKEVPREVSSFGFKPPVAGRNQSQQNCVMIQIRKICLKHMVKRTEMEEILRTKVEKMT
jgi:hypothetical protein